MSTSTQIRRAPINKPKDLRLPALLPRLAVMAVTLLAAAYLAWRPSMLYIAAPLALVGVWLLARNPGLGPWAVLVLSFAVRGGVGTGPQSQLHFGFVLVPALAALWVAQDMFRGSFKLTPSPIYGPLVGLSLTAIISFVAGNLTWNAFAQTAPIRSQIGALGIFLVGAAIFFVVANQVKSMRTLNAYVWTLIAMGTFLTATRLVPALGRLDQYYVLSAAGSMLWLWVPVLAIGQALFNNRLSSFWRLVAAGAGLAMLGYAMSGAARDWASGWVPTLAALAVLVWLRWPRLSTGLGVLGVIAALLNFPFVQTFFLSPDNAYSLFTRSAATEIVWQIALANPLLGVGPANYYWYTPLFPILGFYVNFNSHNQYVDLMAQVGLLGILFYVWFFLAAARGAWKLRVVPDGHAQAYVNACLAGIAGTLVAGALGDWVLPFVYNVGIAGFRAAVIPWLFLGGLVVIQQLYPQRPAPDAAAA